MGLLTSKLAPLFEARGEEFFVTYVKHVRPWKDMLSSSFRFEGAYATRRGQEPPHSFTFARRSGGEAERPTQPNN